MLRTVRVLTILTLSLTPHITNSTSDPTMFPVITFHREGMQLLLDFWHKAGSPVSFTTAAQVAAAKRDLIESDGWLVKDMNTPYFDQPLLLVYRYS